MLFCPDIPLKVAMNEAIDNQIKTIAIPRRFTADVREIWLLQDRLPRRSGKRAERLFAHGRFRAAFDFLELRSRIDGRLKELVKWWADYQAANGGARDELVTHSQHHESHEQGEPGRDRPKRRRRRRPPRRTDEGAA